jgi:sulfite reductase (ferredoxin)
MVRIRIGAGVVSSSQLRRVAELSRQYGNGLVHVTTRQDLQIHGVRIESTPDVLESLLEVGLSSRGGGGNAVRNVTTCPRSGICPGEVFDVTPYALAVAEYLLQFDSSYNLPRKYKIVFSGCAADCGFASVADLGFFAHYRNGAKGFAVYAGGGLGPNPAVGVKVEYFVGEGEIFEVAEAVKRLFDKHGDRANKHKARLRYVLRALGPEQFVRLYRDERAAIRRDGLEGPVPAVAGPGRQSDTVASPTADATQCSHATTDILPERSEGVRTFRLRLPLGDVSGHDLVEIARIAEDYGVSIIRTTQQQNLLIPSVPDGRLSALRSEIGRLNIHGQRQGAPEIVACAGASTCKLGLCSSRGLATAITKKLVANPTSVATRATIRISGCSNSCAQHYIAAVGLQGRARRIGDRLMPCYDVLIGSKTAEGKARLAERAGTVPAKAVPDLVAEFLRVGKMDSRQLAAIARKYGVAAPDAMPEDYYYDWGADQPFSLAGRGPGECGAGVVDVVAVDIEQAKEAVRRSSSGTRESADSQDLYQAVSASARALLILFGTEPKYDREAFNAFGRHLIEPGWVEPAARELLDSAVDWRIGDRTTLADMQERVEQLVGRVEELFLSLDANLKFRLKPCRVAVPACESCRPRVDLRGVACPLNFVKAKLAVEGIGINEVIEIELDDGEPIQNVPGSLSGQGQEILEMRRVEDHFVLRVRRRK